MGERNLVKSIAFAGAGAALCYVSWREMSRRAEIQRYAGIAKGKRIVILGAGFGGMFTAAELARLLPHRDDGEIVLINERDFLLFTPMLTEAAGGELDARHILNPVRNYSERITFIEGRVTGIDVSKKEVAVLAGATGLDPAELHIKADHLVLALGSVTNFHHLPGVKENALQMKQVEDAVAVCDRVLACLERAAIEQDVNRRRELLTFVVAGGGYTGVETMAAINDLVRDSVSKYPNVRASDVRTLLINPGDRLLTETSEELGAYAQRKLQERGVDVRMNTTVSSAGEDYVEVNQNERIPARTLIWAAGVMPNPITAQLAVEKGKHGGIKVNSCCQVNGHPGLWALGDCAEVPRVDGSGTYAPTAQNAIRQGRLVARNVLSEICGDTPTAFRYKPVGELALVGKHSGVARVFGFKFSGLFAWAIWRSVYLAKMPGSAQRARVVTDWLLDLLFGREPLSLIPNGAERQNAMHSAKATAD